MSVETKSEPRKLEDINQEYTALCAQLGDKEFRRSLIESDCTALRAALRRVETEARKAQEAAAAGAVATVTSISEGETADA